MRLLKIQELKQGDQQLQTQLDEVTRLKAKLQEQAIRDPLTGLYNRRYLFEFMQREHKLAKRQPKTTSLLLLDIDHFKKINDTYGHNAGDAVLQSIALLLQEFTRETDLACRYGGEEFAVILPDTSIEGALNIGENMRQNVRDLRITHKLSQTADYITISLGVANIIPKREKYSSHVFHQYTLVTKGINRFDLQNHLKENNINFV